MTIPVLSVVVAVSTPTRPQALVDAIRAIEIGCRDVNTEILVVGHNIGDAAVSELCRVKVFESDATALANERWGVGASAAEGRVVAFTTDLLRVTDRWGSTLVAGIDDGAAGVGGTIALDPRADATTASAHLIRFSAFLPDAHRTRHQVPDIAGDNAAYSRIAIAAHADLLAEGFWEVEFHRRFERDGLTLEMIPDAEATLVGPVTMGSLTRLRYVHGREFAATRVHRHGESRLRIVCAAPLVPFALMVRMRRRVATNATTLSRFHSLIPRLFWLAGAWALGEAVGALRLPKHFN